MKKERENTFFIIIVSISSGNNEIKRGIITIADGYISAIKKVKNFFTTSSPNSIVILDVVKIDLSSFSKSVLSNIREGKTKFIIL